jgi:hypothetical protein
VWIFVYAAVSRKTGICGFTPHWHKAVSGSNMIIAENKVSGKWGIDLYF